MIIYYIRSFLVLCFLFLEAGYALKRRVRLNPINNIMHFKIQAFKHYFLLIFLLTSFFICYKLSKQWVAGECRPFQTKLQIETYTSKLAYRISPFNQQLTTNNQQPIIPQNR